jgi:putative colanic acid biosynthesis UDP-glucose lipid carrier transferase
LTPLFYRLIQIGLILLTGFVGLHLRFYDRSIPNNFYWIVLLLSAFVFLFLGSTKKSGDLSDSYSRLKVLSNTWWQTFVIILLVILLTQSSLLFSRIWLLSWGISTWVLLIFSDLIFGALISKSLIKPIHTINLAIIGDNQASQKLIDYITQSSWSGYTLRHHVKDLSNAELEKIESLQLDEIWICLTLNEGSQFTEVVNKLSSSSAKIKFSPDLFMLRLLNHGISEVAGVPMIDISSSPFEGKKLYLKNLEDFGLSLLFSILFLPVFLVISIFVKLNSPGPVFYQQTRVGLNGKPFEMLKFRTMPVDIEKDGAHWGGSESKVVDSFSLFLRKYNLDELPQFFNVLKGQMSIVGPRPERVEFINQFSKEIPDYAKKHLVKAGITGWAQIHGLRGDTDLHKRIEYDLYYIENWSLLLDLKIILLTAIEPFISKHTKNS